MHDKAAGVGFGGLFGGERRSVGGLFPALLKKKKGGKEGNGFDLGRREQRGLFAEWE